MIVVAVTILVVTFFGSPTISRNGGTTDMRKTTHPVTKPTPAEWVSFAFFTLGTIGQVLAGAVLAVVGIIGSIILALPLIIIGIIFVIIIFLL
jgi:hypothetical protein